MDPYRTHSAMARATLAAFGVESPSPPPPKVSEDQNLDTSIETPPKETPSIATRACDGCRKRRKRCDKLLPQCSACIKRNTTCQYASAAPKKHKRTGSGGSNDADVESSPTPTPSPDITPADLEPSTAEVEVGPELTEDHIARMPYWMYMNRRREMERALEKVQDGEKVGSPVAISKGLIEAGPAEAVRNVFEHYELLDRILSKVEFKTLQGLKRVNKTFQYVVKRSSTLKRAQTSAVDGGNDDDTWSLENHYTR